jgi:hypothetical protein
MSDRENQDEDLKAFEAALGALRPRADGLDRRWRFLLAQEAAFNRSLPESDVLAAGRLVCTRCGGALSSGQRPEHRWAWPTAFSAMTVVAATLLAALVFRLGPQIAVTGGGQQRATTSLTSVLESQTNLAPWLAGASGLPRQPISDSPEASYLSVRDRVLRYGVDSWQLPASAVATADVAAPPLSYREQLNRLLKQECLHGS